MSSSQSDQFGDPARHWSVSADAVLKDTRRRRFTSLIAAVVSFFGILASLYAVFVLYGYDRRLDRVSEDRFAQLAVELERTRKDFAEIRDANATLMKTIADLQKGAGTYAALGPIDRQSLNEIQSGQKVLAARLNALEDAIRVDPTKAVSIPLLRSSMEAMSERQQHDQFALQSEMGRLFGLGQWLFGLMFTVMLGVFSLALANLLRREQQPREVPRESPKSPRLT